MKKKIRRDMAKMFSMKDWEKITIEEVKIRWGNRRREIEEIERKKKEIEEKIEIRKKKKEERRKKKEIEEKIEIRKKKKEERRKKKESD